jgi:glycosyltransferase involved in cell wall biosynthesis
LDKSLLICCEHYWPSLGGVQEVARQLAERFIEIGYQVTVATSSHNNRAKDIFKNGVRVVSFDVIGNQVSGIKGNVTEYRDFLVSNSFDTILIKAAQQWTFDAAADLWGALKSRVVFIPCGFPNLYSPEYSSYYDEMKKWLFDIDSLVFYTKSYRDIDFCKSLGLKNLFFVTNGVDEKEFADVAHSSFRLPIRISSQRTKIISVGTLIASKGHWEVLSAYQLSKLPEPSVLVINGNNIPDGVVRKFLRTIKYCLAGRPPLFIKSFLILVFSLGRKRVIITNLKRKDLLALYFHADLFVFASHSEYSPLVLFESAASGTPFLSSDVGNSREIAAWTGAGEVVSSEDKILDPVVLAREIENILGKTNKLKALGSAGREKFLSGEFTWGRVALDYERILFPPEKSLKR